MQARKWMTAMVLGAAGAGAHAAGTVQLVTNGHFDASDPSSDWSQTSPGKANLIGDWSDQAPVDTGTAFLGGYDNADDVLSQVVHTQTGLHNAILSFDLTDFRGDFAGFDKVQVSFGGHILDTIDLGDDDVPNDYITNNFAYDVTSRLDGSDKMLVFTGTTDGSDPCEAYIDNVSLTGTRSVPEPATLTALSLGALALIRRRKVR